MYVCICKGITDKQIAHAVSTGKTSYAEIRQHFGLGTCCGRCAPEAKKIIKAQVTEVVFEV